MASYNWEEGMKHVGYYIPEELYKRFKKCCHFKHKTMSKVFRSLLNFYCKKIEVEMTEKERHDNA